MRQSKIQVKLNHYLSIPRKSVLSSIKRRKDRYLLNDLINDPYANLQNKSFQEVVTLKNNSMTHV